MCFSYSLDFLGRCSPPWPILGWHMTLSLARSPCIPTPPTIAHRNDRIKRSIRPAIVFGLLAVAAVVGVAALIRNQPRHVKMNFQVGVCRARDAVVYRPASPPSKTYAMTCLHQSRSPRCYSGSALMPPPNPLSLSHFLKVDLVINHRLPDK